MLTPAVVAGHRQVHVDVLDVLQVTVGRHRDRRGQPAGGSLVVVQVVGQFCQRLEVLLFGRTIIHRGWCAVGLLLRNRRRFGNGLAHVHEEGAAFALFGAAAHALPAAGQSGGGLGIHYAEAVVVAVAQHIVAGDACQRAAQFAPATFGGIHLPRGTGQDQRHVTPGEPGVGLQHQCRHARNHRSSGRGSAEVFRVLVLHGGGGDFGGRGRCRAAPGRCTDRQVCAAFTVGRAFAGGVDGTDGDDASRTGGGIG